MFTFPPDEFYVKHHEILAEVKGPRWYWLCTLYSTADPPETCHQCVYFHIHEEEGVFESRKSSSLVYFLGVQVTWKRSNMSRYNNCTYTWSVPTCYHCTVLTCIMFWCQVDENLKILGLDVFYDPTAFLAGLTKGPKAEGYTYQKGIEGCPYFSQQQSQQRNGIVTDSSA